MRIKTFEKATMLEVMEAVRTEMGKEAVILDVKESPKGIFPFSRSGVTVVAASDLTHTEEAALLKKENARVVKPPDPVKPRASKSDSPVSISHVAPCERVTPPAPVLESEAPERALQWIESLSRRLPPKVNVPLSAQTSVKEKVCVEALPWEKKGALRTLYQNVLATGLDAETASHLFSLVVKKMSQEMLTEETVTAYLRGLIQEWVTRFAPPLPELSPEKVTAFVGPTGVGKTTTLIKLASRLCHAQQKVILATMDTYRVGAVEQLRTYAQILGAPMRVIASPAALQALWKERPKGVYIFMDTAGRSPFHDGHIQQLNGLTEVPLSVHLTLAANTREADIHEAVTLFSAALPVDRLLFTKLDETKRRGSLFGVIRKTKVSPSYFTTGQRVPEDIEEATARRIAEEVVK